MTGTIEARLAELGITLPEAPNPVANYVPYAISGNLLFISGQVAKGADGKIVTGALGQDVDIDAGQAAARLCALNILAQARPRSAASTASCRSCGSPALSTPRPPSPTIRRS